MSYGSYGSYGVPKKSYSYSMSAHTHVYTSGNVKASKTSKNMKVPGAESNKLAKNSAEMFIARNFARSVHKIITDISGEDLPIDFQFHEAKHFVKNRSKCICGSIQYGRRGSL